MVGLDQETFVDLDAVAIPTPTSLQRPCHYNVYFSQTSVVIKYRLFPTLMYT